MDSAERNRPWIEERLGEGSFPEQEDPVGETPPSR